MLKRLKIQGILPDTPFFLSFLFVPFARYFFADRSRYLRVHPCQDFSGDFAFHP